MAGAVLALVACAAPVTPGSPTPAPELGAVPSSIPEDDRPVALTPAPTASPTPNGVAPSSPSPTPDRPTDGRRASPTPSDQPAPTTSSSPRPERRSPEASPTESSPTGYRPIGGGSDRRGDHGVQGPGYADLVEVGFADDGQRLRVRVDLAADVPARLDEGEVIGLGVDLLRDADGESRYQLFADGGDDGWLAYLQTPDGFVAYPGTFAIGGRRVEFVVPWTSVGSFQAGPARVFLDWAGDGIGGVLHAASEDRLPDTGDLHLQR